jgi:hypothetical protein
MSDPTTPAEANPSASPADRATTFQPVQGPQPEHYSGEVLLVSAYAIVWAVMLAWVGITWRKQASMSARIEELERVLDRAAGPEGTK